MILLFAAGRPGLRFIVAEEVDGVEVYAPAVVVVVPDGLRVAVSAYHPHLPARESLINRTNDIDYK